MDRITVVQSKHTCFHFSLNHFKTLLSILLLAATTTIASASTRALSVGTASLPFGSVRVGTTVSKSVTVTSSGDAAVTIYMDTISGTGFSVSHPNFPISLNPGQSTTFSVWFTPASASSVTGQLNISSDAPTVSVSLSGTGTPVSALSLSASSLAFGNVSLGGVASKSVTVTSSGSGTVTINSDATSGTGFSVSHASFPITLNPGQSTVFTIYFNPASANPVTGQLTISSNGPSANVSLSGTGISPQPTVSGLSCGSNSFTGSSTTTCTVSLSSAALSGGQTVALASNSSSLTVPSSVTVASGASSASFAANIASVSAAQSVTITASSNSSSRSFAIQLNAPVASLRLSTSSLAFGNVAVGTAVSQSVTVTASGSAAVTINSDATSGTGFSVSHASFPITLNPGQSTVFSIYFNPASASAVTGQLTISSNAPMATISLSGTGTTVTPTVSAISCSNTSITGSQSDPCTVSLSGAAPSGGISVLLASSNSAVSVPSSVTVSATSSTAAFTANVAGVSSAQSATLTATTGSISKTVALQLNAGTPKLNVNATSISFGAIAVNGSTTQSVALTSGGTAPVTVNSIAVTGSGFSGTATNLPATLNSGQSLSVSLIFHPTTTGSASGTLTITSNSSTGSTISVPLSGTGNAHKVDLSWVAASGSTDPAVGYNIYRAPGGTTSYQRVNSSVEGTTGYTDTSVQSGATYAYMVKSVDSKGNESVPSNVTNVTIP